MATKLKNYKYHFIIRFLCVVLTCVFAFLSAYNCVFLLREAIFYAGGNFKETPAFSDSIHTTLNKLYGYAADIKIYKDDMTYEEFLETKTAQEISDRYAQEEARALKIFAVIQDLKLLEPKDAQYEEYYDPDTDEYYFEEEGVTGYRVSSDYPDNPTDEELFTIKKEYTTYSDWNGKYQQLRNEIFMLVDDATSEETIKAELNGYKTDELYLYYTKGIHNTQRELSEFSNVQFLLRDNETGNVISNIPKAERKEFANNLHRDSLFYINFNGSKLLSPEVNTSSSTNILKFLTETDIFDSTVVNTEFMTDRFNGCTVYLKLPTDVIQGDCFYNQVQAFNSTNKTESYYKINTIIFAILSLSFLILTCSFAGKTKDDGIRLTFADRVPFVIQLLFTVLFIGATGLGAGCGVIIDAFPTSTIFDQVPELIWIVTNNLLHKLTALCVSLLSLSVLNFALYISKNVKAGKLSDRFLIGVICKKISILHKKHVKKALSLKAVRKQMVFALGAYVIVNLILFLISLDEYLLPAAIVGLVIFNALSIVYAAIYLSDVTRLSVIAEQIRNGTFNTEIRPNTFVKPLRPFAVNLSDCRDSIQIAIDNAVKGEQLKTELITNVSHDLKTPLTSIINYVSLLKLCEIDNADAKGYIQILDDKSKKLKRLIEDLTEASKATSGNIKMKQETVNLNELALQAVGENSDALENAGLDVVLTEKDEAILVLADSQHTFRVIDNLFSNARKYSLKGTRVYVDVFRDGNYGAFSIKNISRDKLNLTPEELTERFVRGDNSRSTDGSGLGLSIAQSFTELQNGIFTLEIDGDMFKVTLKFPVVSQ